MLVNVKGKVKSEIKWNWNVGVTELFDVCTKRLVYWIKLTNGQAAQVVDVSIVLNPFPRKGQSHYCTHHVETLRPGLKQDIERKAYADALVAAGMWLGEMIARHDKPA